MRSFFAVPLSAALERCLMRVLDLYITGWRQRECVVILLRSPGFYRANRPAIHFLVDSDPNSAGLGCNDWLPRVRQGRVKPWHRVQCLWEGGGGRIQIKRNSHRANGNWESRQRRLDGTGLESKSAGQWREGTGDISGRDPSQQTSLVWNLCTENVFLYSENIKGLNACLFH